MASIRKHPRSKFFYACVTIPNGKQRQFSTGLSDPDEALAAATAAERALRKDHSNPARLRQALDRLAADYDAPDTTDPAPWLRAWAAARKPEVSAATASAYATTAASAAAFFEARRLATFAAISTAHVTALRDQWAAENSAVTANTKLKILRIALKAARVAKLIDSEPAAQVAFLREKATRRREFRTAELELLLPTLSPDWRAMALLGLYTGQRLSDLACLRWSNIDLQTATITLRAAKTGALVCLPLAAPALEAVLALPSADRPADPVFPALAAVTHGARSNQFRRALAAVGLAGSISAYRKKDGAPAKTRRTTGELSFHSLRHTATTWLKAAGVADGIARAIIGHQSAAVSQRYTHLDLDTMRQAIEKLPALKP